MSELTCPKCKSQSRFYVRSQINDIECLTFAGNFDLLDASSEGSDNSEPKHTDKTKCLACGFKALFGDFTSDGKKVAVRVFADDYPIGDYDSYAAGALASGRMPLDIRIELAGELCPDCGEDLEYEAVSVFVRRTQTWELTDSEIGEGLCPACGKQPRSVQFWPELAIAQREAVVVATVDSN